MKHERRPHVWIVEWFVFGRWSPSLSGQLNKKDARQALDEWKRHNPDRKFRLRRYVRESNKCDL